MVVLNVNEFLIVVMFVMGYYADLLITAGKH